MNYMLRYARCREMFGKHTTSSKDFQHSILVVTKYALTHRALELPYNPTSILRQAEAWWP